MTEALNEVKTDYCKEGMEGTKEVLEQAGPKKDTIDELPL